jgi:CBS domain containing-hemolysin-like protein
MLYVTILLIVLSAALGLTILVKWLTQKHASRAVVYSHGIAAATAVILLIFYAIQHPLNYPRASIILFTLGAFGGIYMFIDDLRKKNSPLALAYIHALLAVGGLVTLLIFVFE